VAFQQKKDTFSSTLRDPDWITDVFDYQLFMNLSIILSIYNYVARGLPILLPFYPFFVTFLYHFCNILQAEFTSLIKRKSLSLQSYVPIM